MSDRVEVKIVGDESGAQAAMRRAAQAVAEATATMKTKLTEVQNSSRAAFNGMGREAREAGEEVNDATGRMGGALDRLKAQFSAFTTGFTKGWRDVGNELREARAASEAVGEGGAKGIGRFGMAMEVFKGGLMLEGARKLLEVGKAVVTTSAEFERLRSVLLTLEGSQDAANARFDQLKKFGQETPYELSEVVTAFAKLKAQGLDPSNAALQSYGNTAAAMGKSLDQMVEAVADAAMGEYERLKEFGIKAQDAGDKVIFNFKGQATEVKKNSADIQAYLQKIGNTDFAGAMDRQMDTLGGKFSNLADAAAGFADQIGQGGLSQALKGAMDAMTGATGTSEELAHSIGAVLGAGIRNFMSLIETLVGAVKDIFGTIKDVITDAFGKSAGSALTFGNILRGVATVCVSVAGVIRGAFLVIVGVVQTAINTLATFSRIVYNLVTLNFSGMVDAVKDGVNRQVSIVTNGAKRIGDAYGQTKARIGEIWSPPKVAKINPGAASDDTPGKGSTFGKAGGGAKKGPKGPSPEAIEREADQEAVAAIRDREDMEREAAKSTIELSRLALQAQLDDIDTLRTAGQMSAQQAVAEKANVNRQLRALDVQLENAEFNARMRSLVDQRARYKTTQKEYADANREIEKLKQAHDNRMRILEAQNRIKEKRDEAEALQQKRAAMTGIAQSWAQNLAKMATLQQGFGATVKGMWQSLVGSFEQAIARMIQQWIMSLLVKEATSKTFHMKEVLLLAKQAAAGAWASVVKIPFVGPALAPIAAAAAFAGTMAFSAKGGYDVPEMAGPGIDGKGGQMGVVHPREMILPAEYADMIRNGGMGGMQVHISAVDARSVRRLFMDHNSDLAKALRKHVRDGGRA